ncbi:unnamed protein product [Menidia menidia]|uniref:(Atlantic silverside) hypothetical protein n=1 Tax=Menidia menidia TaxID=238744 RepID=A0A8S4BN14_9TELE|nr:unnamed protein product [Menidia menidia]
MRHTCGRDSSDKAVIVCKKQPKTTEKNCCSVKKLPADKDFSHLCEKDGQQKIKRLKTRKERSQLRADWKETSKTKSHIRHICRHISTDVASLQTCCHWNSKKNASISSAVPAAHEPSIITDSRLIGHHGLFNHEVKSIDIERLLSEKSKCDQTGQQVKDKNENTSNLSLTSQILAPLSTDSLLVVDANDDVPLKMKTNPTTKASSDCQETDGKILPLGNPGSDITPGQREQQHVEVSSEGVRSILSPKQSSHRVDKTKSTNHVTPEKDNESQQTPFTKRGLAKTSNRKVKRRIISGLNQPEENQSQQTDDDNTSPLQMFLSATSDGFDAQHRGPDSEDMSKSVSALASRFSECLSVPHRTRRNLVSECRAILAKSMQESHGPRLQENLHQVQQCVRFGVDPTQAVPDQQPEKDAPEWSTKPVNESTDPGFSTQFYMDFEPCAVPPSNVFACSPPSCIERKDFASELWQDSVNMSNGKDTGLFDSFESSFINPTKDSGESSFGQQDNYNNIQFSFPYRGQLLDRRSEKPLKIAQGYSPIGTGSHAFASSFPSQFHHIPQGNHYQPLSQLNQHSTGPKLRSHHTDMMQYPPSYMLEKSPAPSSSFLSPEQWFFPPMRLY